MTAKKRIELRSWRVAEAQPSGLFVWFDPARESVELYEVEPPTESGVGDPNEKDDHGQIWLFQSDQNEVLELVEDLPF